MSNFLIQSRDEQFLASFDWTVFQKLTKCDEYHPKIATPFLDVNNAEISHLKKKRYRISDKFCLIYSFCMIFCSSGFNSVESKEYTGDLSIPSIRLISPHNRGLTNHEGIQIYQQTLTFVVGKYENLSHRNFYQALLHVKYCSPELVS